MEMTTEQTTRPICFLPEPKALEDTGLDFELIVDLCLKTVFFGGRPSAKEICERVCLPFSIIEDALGFLRRQERLDIVGTTGITEQDYQYAITSKGSAKAQEVLERNHYVGPAPVPFDLYVDVVARQSVRTIDPTPEKIEAAFDRLVFDDETLAQIGTAVGSGRSVFFYGPPGNGKSTIAECISNLLPDDILVPYAIEVFGQIVRVHEPRVHHPGASLGQADAQANAALFNSRDGRDRRWAISRRPVLITGGELTMNDLEMSYSPVGKFYIAPPQVKANNGVLVIDDFGRQRMRPEELLNRWMVPMDRDIDYLTFQTGETAAVPFDVMLIFATNLPPSSLGDEAFFRRIRHKVYVPDPDERTFKEILQKAAARTGIPYNEATADYLLKTHYQEQSRNLRGVHPRDIFDLIVDMARYRRETPAFTPEWVDRACRSYFVED